MSRKRTPSKKGFIYKILNNITGDFYVGSTGKHMGTRKGQHLYQLRRGCHFNKHLQSSFDKHGEDNFRFEIVEEFLLPESDKPRFILKKEVFWITELNPKYNKAREIVGSRLGVKLSAKHVESMKNRVVSEETKVKIRAARAKQIITQEHKDAISRANKGRIVVGKPCSEETKQKLSISVRRSAEERGYWKTPAQIENAASKLRGHKHTQEYKEACRERRLGTKHTESQKLKIKESVRRHYFKEFNVFDLRNNYIGSFGIVIDAVVALGLTIHAKTGILSALKGRQISCQGYIFKYK